MNKAHRELVWGHLNPAIGISILHTDPRSDQNPELKTGGIANPHSNFHTTATSGKEFFTPFCREMAQSDFIIHPKKILKLAETKSLINIGF